MKFPIFTKIFGSCVLITIVLSALIPLLSFKTIKTQYIATYTGNLKNLAIILKPEILSFIHERKFKELDIFVKSLKNEMHSRITIIDKQGVVVADSEKDPKTMENHKIRPEVIEAFSGGVGTSRRFSVTVEEEMLYVALPIEKDNVIIGVIRLSAFLKQINALLYDIKIKIFWIAFVITIFSLIFSLVLSKSISTPLNKLVQAAKTLSRGDFNTRIFLRKDDEMKELADSFNNMASKMHGLFEEVSNNNEELNTIISSIQEMLLVFDKEGKIKLSNESFKKLINNDNIEGKFHWEILRSPEFGELVKQVTTEKKHFTGEVRLQEKVFLCSITFLTSRDEMIAIFHDITDFKNLETIKRDFVANISHELRTPLTAIKGFVETLEDEEDIKNPHYLEVIKRHTDRLMNIVGDLLLLSELEEKGIEIEFEEVSLTTLAENTLKIFDQKAKEKGLTFNVHAEEGIPLIKADPFKLEQMLINLIDNAIKYTEQGEINVSLYYSHPYVKIAIEDTGMGIPGKHLQRIFERFYVVDKSRSKKLGGTGLGLSIVKHIVLLHGGTIDVESAMGKGTKFIVTIPTNLN
ncbi:MAG: ATP-binding protein [Proteobacteria bacterium]|nr:ATP-binding protein [Pseudomonadota bacterium]